MNKFFKNVSSYLSTKLSPTHIAQDGGSDENLRGCVVIGGHNLSPLVEIGLNDLHKPGVLFLIRKVK